MLGSDISKKLQWDDTFEVSQYLEEIGDFPLWQKAFANIANRINMGHILDTAPATEDNYWMDTKVKLEKEFETPSRRTNQESSSASSASSLIEEKGDEDEQNIKPILILPAHPSTKPLWAKASEKAKLQAEELYNQSVKKRKEEHAEKLKRFQDRFEGDGYVEITPQKPKVSGLTYVAFDENHFRKDNVEQKLFKTNYVFVNAKTGEVETKSAQRTFLWHWTVKSLSKGPGAHLPQDCEVPFDVGWVYRKVKAMCKLVTRLTHAEYLTKFFTKRRDGSNPAKCRSEIVHDAESVDSMGREIGLPSCIPDSVKCAMLIAAVAAADNEEMFNQRAILDLSLKKKDFDMDDLLEALRNQQALVDSISKQRHQSIARVNIQQSSKAECKYFKNGNCKSGDKCRFSHEAPMSNNGDKGGDSSNRGRDKEDLSASETNLQCKKCGEQHHSSECNYKGTCDYCKERGHIAGFKFKKSGKNWISCPKKMKAVLEKRKQANSVQVYEDQEVAIMGLNARPVKNTPSRVSNERALLDSGANCFAIKNKKFGRNLQKYKMEVGTASDGQKLYTECNGTLSTKIGGRTLNLKDVIFDEKFSYNAFGAVVLDKRHSLTSMFHNGELILVDGKSVKIPDDWEIVSRQEYDKETGLPFMDIKIVNSLEKKRNQASYFRRKKQNKTKSFQAGATNTNEFEDS